MKHRPLFLLLPLFLAFFGPLSCRNGSPLLPPQYIAPPPVCGFTLLGPTLCGAAASGLTVIRTASAWNTFAAAATCVAPGPAPVVDFKKQMVLVFTVDACEYDPRSYPEFTSVCLYATHLDVTVHTGYQAAIMAPVRIGYCKNVAVA